MRFPSQAALLLLIVGLAGIAQAGPIHEYSIDNPPGSAAGGKIESIVTRYDEGTQTFSWEHTIRDRRGRNNAHDSFWLVVSDGPNPKADPREYAILFGDLDTRTLWAYEYSGANSSNSWHRPGNLIETWSDAIDVTRPRPDARRQTVSFTIDASNVNAHLSTPLWDGIDFSDTIGIWFHPARRTRLAIDPLDGGIASYRVPSGKAGYYDAADRPTARVPEPRMLSILGLGGLLLVLARRRGTAPRPPTGLADPVPTGTSPADPYAPDDLSAA